MNEFSGYKKLYKAMRQILDYTEDNGLVICDDAQKAKNHYEFLHIEDAKKIGATAVFFRRFYKADRPEEAYFSEPAVSIFAKESNFINSDEHIKLHAELWSAGRNEVYIILTQEQLTIINARKPAQLIRNKLNIGELILLSSNAANELNDKRFSAYLFGSGTFWEQGDFYNGADERFLRNKLEEENMPYHQLLSYLKLTRRNLRRDGSIAPEIIDKLLIICILIKFLEEIKTVDGAHTLAKIYQKHAVVSFAEALTIKGKSIAILEELGKKLNGHIFDYFTDKSEQESQEQYQKRNDEIKNSLRDTSLTPIANFLLVRVNRQTGELEFDIETNQLRFSFGFNWQQYSFRHLPIELISSIYEHFLQEDAKENQGEQEKGVVYTPPFLVNFLIDEVMPLHAFHKFSSNQFRIVDPSCGSGVFLVAAYKRLLQWWIINYYETNRCLPTEFDPKIFQSILEKNIFGVDINRKATLITIFSLTIAFLDKLDPIAFWENINFTKLRSNIETKNFFEWASNTSRKFDLAIGNPPFNIETGKDKKDVLVPELIDSLNFKHREIPNNNFALHFFEAAMAFAKKTCLIIPSNVVLYNKSSQSYRVKIFTDFSISKIVDFTHLRRDLFHKTADTPVVAIIAENIPSTGEAIEHIVIKRTISTEKKLRFDIDYYDNHRVSWNWAVDPSKQFIWKTNLLGGGRLFHLIYRLSLLPKLSELIDSKKPNWKDARGYEGGSAYTFQNKDRIVSINASGAVEVEKDVVIKTDKLKDEFMYTPPFLVMDQVLSENGVPVSLIPINHKYTSKAALYFNRDFIGISVPDSDEKYLKDIYARMTNRNANHLNYKLFLLATSSSSLVLTETDVNKSEILNVPFPEDKAYLDLSDSEKIIQEDVLKYYIHLGKAISKGSAGYALHQKSAQKQLKSYQTVFCNTLNNIYEKKGKSWQPGAVLQTSMYCICQLGFGKTGKLKKADIENLADMDNQLKILISNEMTNRAASYMRVIRIYKHIDGYDCVFLIKPNSQRYWLNSIALRDADDTYLALKKEGY